MASAAILLGTVAMFVVYFEKANASFAAASLPAADLGAELERWGRWHSLRTVLASVALGLALVAVAAGS